MLRKTDQVSVHEVPDLDLAALRVRYGADYSTSNPYQHLLYSAVGPGVDAKPCGISAALAEITGEPGPMIYHLHWEDHVLKHVDAAQAARNAQTLIDGLEAFASAGGKIVWTRHNLRPHDAGHHDIHADMLSHLARIASVVHVHSWQALEQISEHEPTDPAKTAIIGHGNYLNHYPGWAAPTARDGFGFDPDTHVFLLFGRLGGYKQVTQTAEIFAAIKAPHARLVIAGTADAPDLSDLPDDARISLIAQHIPDAEVGRYFAATDTVLLPYRACLTSGTAMLAAGFARGVLGTNVAGLRCLVQPGETGALYDDGGSQAAIQQALHDGRAEWLTRGKVAGNRAALCDWRIFGRQWRDLFHGLVGHRKTGDLAAARIVAP